MLSGRPREGKRSYSILESVKLRSINQESLSLRLRQGGDQVLCSIDARFLERVRSKPAFDGGRLVFTLFEQNLEKIGDSPGVVTGARDVNNSL